MWLRLVEVVTKANVKRFIPSGLSSDLFNERSTALEG